MANRDGTTAEQSRVTEGSIRRDEAEAIPWMWIPELLLEDVWHHPHACATFAKYMPRGGLVLEVGFGSGRLLTKIGLARACRAVGLDIDRGAFSSLRFFAQREGYLARAVQGSGFRLPFGDGVFDAVYSEGVLEHFCPDDARRLLAEQVRVCRAGGRVVFSVPNRFAPLHSLTKAFLGRRFLFYPERSLSVFECARLVREAGLRLVAQDGFAFGCQFYDFKVFVLDEILPRGWRKPLLAPLELMQRIGLYHFDVPKLNALIGFQVLVVGEKR